MSVSFFIKDMWNCSKDVDSADVPVLSLEKWESLIVDNCPARLAVLFGVLCNNEEKKNLPH